MLVIGITLDGTACLQVELHPLGLRSCMPGLRPLLRVRE